MQCVWFFCDVATIFCNNFARWLQKIVATSQWCSRRQLTHFWNESPFHTFSQNFNLWLTGLTNCLKWRFFPKMRWVADGCNDAMCWVFWDAMSFYNNFARWLQTIVVRARNAVWMSKRIIGIRWFLGLVAKKDELFDLTCGEHKLRDFKTPYLRNMVEHTWVLISGECCAFLSNRFWVSYVN